MVGEGCGEVKKLTALCRENYPNLVLNSYAIEVTIRKYNNISPNIYVISFNELKMVIKNV